MCLIIAALLIASVQLVGADPPGDVVFSEIMWMGSSGSSADEWLELYNRSDREVDLGGWTVTRLTDGTEQPMLTIEAGRLAPGGTFLIANYGADDDRSRLSATPDLVDKAIALPNDRLQLRLYDAGGILLDVADDGTGAPSAGDADGKRSMVRVAMDQDGTSAGSWETAVEAAGWDASAAELGTPGSIPERLGGDGDAAPPSPTALRRGSWATLKRSVRR